MASLSDTLWRYVVSPPQLICRDGEADKMRCCFIFTPDFAGFQGHFPGAPLLPGIVQIMLARYTAAVGKRAELTSVKRCKFLHPIRPGETVTVNVKPGRQPGEYQAEIFSEDTPCSRIAFRLEHSEVWQ